MKTEKAVITKEEIIGIHRLFTSTDKENETVGLSILEECDHLQSLPWLIILYREMSIDLQKELSNKAPKLDEFLSNYIKVGNTLSINDCYNLLIKIANSEAVIEYMISRFSDTLSNQLLNWGFQFMQEYDLIIKPKDDNTRQK